MPPKNASAPVTQTATAKADTAPEPTTTAPAPTIKLTPAPPAITVENTVALAYRALKTALQLLITAKVAETAPLRLTTENAFEALRVGTEQRRFEFAALQAASEALAGPVAFLNNTSAANTHLVNSLTADAGIIAKRVVLLTPKADEPKA